MPRCSRCTTRCARGPRPAPRWRRWPTGWSAPTRRRSARLWSARPPRSTGAATCSPVPSPTPTSERGLPQMTTTAPRPTGAAAKQSLRTELLEARPVNLDGFVEEWPEKGLVAMESEFDPAPSVRVEGGRIVELDGRSRNDFDFMDTFIANHAIDVASAEASMAIPSAQIARMLIDPGVSRDEVLAVTRGLTPAKVLDVVKLMNVVEIMQGMQKMRARRTPANQGHSTSARDNPIQVAADAAEGALRGFAELETTLGVLRYAPLVAIALQVGAQVGRGGVLTQCALEEATELELGMRGITAYAETISIYGTESVFVDGDDTPWPKSFLAAADASRGIKMRFTSGTGSEVQMGNAEGKSMLYLEIRCILMAKGAGVQGLQNGSISCLRVAGAGRSRLLARGAGRAGARAGALGVASRDGPGLSPPAQ